jgi:hypothetical protein
MYGAISIVSAQVLDWRCKSLLWDPLPPADSQDRGVDLGACSYRLQSWAILRFCIIRGDAVSLWRLCRCLVSLRTPWTLLTAFLRCLIKLTLQRLQRFSVTRHESRHGAVQQCRALLLRATSEGKKLLFLINHICVMVNLNFGPYYHYTRYQAARACVPPSTAVEPHGILTPCFTQSSKATNCLSAWPLA